MEKTNRRAGELIIQAIKKQIRQNDPPETKETFDRVRLEGHAEEEVYRMLGCVLTSEMYAVLRQKTSVRQGSVRTTASRTAKASLGIDCRR